MLIKNGFTQKSNVLQITSYVLFFGDVVIFYVFLVPLLSNPLKIAASVSEFFPAFLSAYFAYYCTKSDPTDKQVKEYRQNAAEGKHYSAESKEFYCTECLTYVSEKSRHCKRCDRCVENFDHHCKWVNNCIGASNYKQFLCLIVSVLIFSGIFVAFTVVATIQFATNGFANLENTYSQKLGTVTGLIIIVWIFSLPTIVMFIMDFNLIVLHIYLIKKKMTTLEYILNVREKKEAQQQREEEQKNLKLRGKVQTDQLQKDGRTCVDFILCIKPKKRKKEQQSFPKNATLEIPFSNRKKNNELSENGNNQPEFASKNKTNVALAVIRDNAIGIQQQDDPLSSKFNKEQQFHSTSNHNGQSHESERGLISEQVSASKLSADNLIISNSNIQQESTIALNPKNQVNQDPGSQKEGEDIAVKKIGQSASQIKLLFSQENSKLSIPQEILTHQINIKGKNLTGKHSDKLIIDKTEHSIRKIEEDLSFPNGDAHELKFLGQLNSRKASDQLK